jgi:hypothetical protein
VGRDGDGAKAERLAVGESVGCLEFYNNSLSSAISVQARIEGPNSLSNRGSGMW